MYVDAESMSGPVWSTAGDPRITPIGRLLRAMHLDELPQMGFFIEIEAADEAAVDRMREKLGLAGEPIVTSTYIDLADHLAAAPGSQRAELRF